jgi:hypothetical protein
VSLCSCFLLMYASATTAMTGKLHEFVFHPWPTQSAAHPKIGPSVPKSVENKPGAGNRHENLVSA